MGVAKGVFAAKGRRAGPLEPVAVGITEGENNSWGEAQARIEPTIKSKARSALVRFMDYPVLHLLETLNRYNEKHSFFLRAGGACQGLMDEVDGRVDLRIFHAD